MLAQLLGPGERAGEADLRLDARARADYGAGRLYVTLDTQGQPLGTGQAVLVALR